MGVMKKAPLLGSAASVGESGRSVIEGDRSLLSHYGRRPQRQNGALPVTERKSAALRRNLVARGLARQYGDQKAREETFKAQMPRYQRQQKILENYQRHQAQRTEETRKEDTQHHEDSDDEDEFSDDVVLVVPKRTNSAPSKSSNRATRRISPIVPPKGASSFLRSMSMRQLRENELGEEETGDGVAEKSNQSSISTSLKHSPSEAEIPLSQLRPIPRPSSSRHPQIQNDLKANEQAHGNLVSAPTPWLPANRSSRIVLRELGITKDIMMREQLVRQLKQTLPVVDTLAQDFIKGQDTCKQAQNALEMAKAMFPSRMKKTNSLIGLTLTSPADEEQAQNAVAEAEVALTESKARLSEVTKRLRHHIHHVEMLVAGLQEATLNVVEGIVDWRQMRQRRRQLSNFQRLFRFPWRKQRIANYLMHVDDDLQAIFPSVALALLLGPKATYNPLLLSRTTLEKLGTSSTGKTFLTESEGCGVRKPAGSVLTLHQRATDCCINSAALRRMQEVLSSAIDDSDSLSAPAIPVAPPLDHNRLRRCLEAIHQEKELEAVEKQRCGEEEQRLESTYDPFSTIKGAGGVEETLTNMMALQSPTSHLLGEQLRTRQEDTTRASPLSVANQPDQKEVQAETLHVNPERLRLFLEKRAALLESSADCEIRGIQRWGHTNKLQGKVVVRKNNEKRVENHLARKIQLQYLAHRQRHTVKTNLAELVRSVRFSAINIQRVFRGHRAKCEYEDIRNAWLEHKRQVDAVRIVVNAFRRYRRRQHHRRSMTVESIAQAQLISILSNKLHESGDAQDAAERYRRVGEERRRQRIVLLQKHKMEQQEMERKRIAAAVRMQAVVRAHLAQGQAKILRQEKKAHMSAVSAMAIQSTIRKFLNVQQARRQRFRKDLERVNHSAVRIQSIYRGYNSRASLLGQLDGQTRQILSRGFTVAALHEGDSDDEDDEEDAASSDEEDETLHHDTQLAVAENTLVAASSQERLPPIITSNSRPSSGKSELRSYTPTNPVALPPLWNRDRSCSSLQSAASSTGTGRRISTGMTRVELKLKEAELGDKFDTPPSRRNSFMGSMRHLL